MDRTVAHPSVRHTRPRIAFRIDFPFSGIPNCKCPTFAVTSLLSSGSVGARAAGPVLPAGRSERTSGDRMAWSVVEVGAGPPRPLRWLSFGLAGMGSPERHRGH